MKVTIYVKIKTYILFNIFVCRIHFSSVEQQFGFNLISKDGDYLQPCFLWKSKTSS